MREIEQNLHFKPKVRLRRAQVLRLSNRGFTSKQINAYTARNRVSIGHDFDCWQEHGLESLTGSAPLLLLTRHA